MLLVGALNIVFGVGALQLKPWAWQLGIVCQGIGIVLGLAQFGMGRRGSVVGLVIAGVILWYLFQPDVKRAFAVS